MSFFDRFRTLRELCRREYGDEFAKKYDIIVIHDNAYSELIFDGGEGLSFLQNFARKFRIWYCVPA